MLDSDQMLRSRVDLLVIGAGPTGIAALARAVRRGLDAIAVEGGSCIASGIARYPNHLVFMTSPWDFTIDGLPLDCRDPRGVGRDEVLSYLGRVVRHRRLRVAVDTSCIRLEPGSRAVRCTLLHRGVLKVIRARHVVVTSWYEPRSLPRSLVRGAARPAIALRGHEPLDTGGAIAVLGGGVSAYESAVALMTRGVRVTVLARHRVVSMFGGEQFLALAKATGTRIQEGTHLLAIECGAISYEDQLGRVFHLRVAGVVCCFGTRWSRKTFTMLLNAGVLTGEEVTRIRRAKVANVVHTLGSIDEGTKSWPDLWSHMYEGRHGVHLAGGAVHTGGRTGGLAASIKSATECVDAIAGHCERPLERPLARALLSWALTDHPAPLSFDDLSDIVPWPIWSWNRSALPTLTEYADGRKRPAILYRCWTGKLEEDPTLVTRFLQRADGSRTVGDLARIPGFGGWRGVLGLLVQLWTMNAMTWLPRDMEQLAERPR